MQRLTTKEYSRNSGRIMEDHMSSKREEAEMCIKALSLMHNLSQSFN